MTPFPLTKKACSLDWNPFLDNGKTTSSKFFHTIYHSHKCSEWILFLNLHWHLYKTYRIKHIKCVISLWQTLGWTPLKITHSILIIWKKKTKMTNCIISKWYEDHWISFQTFFVWALLLIEHTWNSSPLRSNLLPLQCTCYTVPTTSERPYGSPLVWACQWLSSQPLSSPQLSHNDSLWA